MAKTRAELIAMFHTGATVTEEMFGYLFQSLYNKEDEKNLVSKTDLQSILGDPQNYRGEADLPTRMSNAEKQFDNEEPGSLAELVVSHSADLMNIESVMSHWLSYMERFADMMGLEWEMRANGTHAMWLLNLWSGLNGNGLAGNTPQPVMGGPSGDMWDTPSTGLTLPNWLKILFYDLVDNYGVGMAVTPPPILDGNGGWDYEQMGTSISKWLSWLWSDINDYFNNQGWMLSAYVSQPALI